MSDDGYKVELIRARYASGVHPAFQVTTPSGKTFTCETKWGVAKVIRMDKQARKLNEKARRK